jgi:hypothetical protein
LVAFVGALGFGCSTTPEVEDARTLGDQPGTPGDPGEPDLLIPGESDWQIDVDGPDSPDLPGPDAPGTLDEPDCGAAAVVEMLAGQTNNAGTVTITNGVAALCVTFVANEGWYIRGTHIDIALEMPQGNPPPGSFTDAQVHDPAVGSYTACFSLESFGYEPGMDIFVGAHADLTRMTYGVEFGEESGWGHGEPAPGHNWAEYVKYTIQECTE